MRRGLSLTWLIIVVALIAISVYAYLVFNNSDQQAYRQSDIRLQSVASSVYKAVLRYRQSAAKTYSEVPLKGVSLASKEGRAVLKVLTDSSELHASTSSSPDLGRIYISTTSLDQFNICFAPRSFVFKTHRETRYDSSGDPSPNCHQGSCYFCFISNRDYVAAITPTPIPENFIATQDPCAGFDPERPLFPFTTHTSSRWLSYGCLSYTIEDKGCNPYSICGANRRQLVKKFTGLGLGRLSCLFHQKQTLEAYCVDEPQAKCLEHPGISRDSDFTWGCESPYRPTGWQ